MIIGDSFCLSVGQRAGGGADSRAGGQVGGRQGYSRTVRAKRSRTADWHGRGGDVLVAVKERDAVKSRAGRHSCAR
jgi:hypothetical protein